jgi:RimJ/RimL family protein N-acetyltransferase
VSTDGHAVHDRLLLGRRVILRPLFSSDYDWLYALATDQQVGRYWRFRGHTPSPETFVASIWAGVAAQFVVTKRADQTRIGLMQFDQFNAESGYGYLSAILHPDVLGAGWPIESLYLFVNYLFITRNLRKIYIEASGAALTNYQSAVGALLVEEGRLVDHDYVDGRFVDCHLLALYRQTWESNRASVDRFLVDG